jgi:hypothetical protein
MCLQKIQERNKSKCKKERQDSISLRSLERERYIAKVKKNSTNIDRKSSHGKPILGFTILNSSSQNTTNIYDSKTSLGFAKKLNFCASEYPTKPIRLGKQPKNNDGLRGHTFDHTQKKLGLGRKKMSNNYKDYFSSVNELSYVSKEGSNSKLNTSNELKFITKLNTNQTPIR